jgi:SAM-dependent methyltransferase
MCNTTGLEFGARVLTAERIAGKDVIDVGALDVNGSLRPVVEPLGPARYVGVDIEMGPGVDEVVAAEGLVSRYGRESFDVVITTEMVEHVRDWPTVMSNLKGILRPNGLLLLTTRSKGFKYHAYPYDFWRYEPADLRAMFSDLDIVTIEQDTDAPGVFMLASRPEAFAEKGSTVKLFSMITGRRERSVSDRQVRLFLLRYRLVQRLSPARYWLRWQWRRGRQLFHRLRSALWRAIPADTRAFLKRRVFRRA